MNKLKHFFRLAYARHEGESTGGEGVVPDSKNENLATLSTPCPYAVSTVTEHDNGRLGRRFRFQF
jgi:hypothetical protein